MTIPALLEHVGIDVPRYVTVAGRIVLDKGQTSAGAPAPMVLAPHRFHDGDDPAPVRTVLRDAWWNLDIEAREADQKAMAHHFPNFVQFGEDGDYAYGGEIDTGKGRFQIFVLPQIDHSLPSVVPLKKDLGRQVGRRLQRPLHVYNSGHLCVADVSDWDPSRHTTATAVGWAAHWFAAYTEWRITGRWPTEGFGAAA